MWRGEHVAPDGAQWGAGSPDGVPNRKGKIAQMAQKSPLF